MRKLPHISDVFEASVFTREFTHKGLRAAYRTEYRRLVARVVQFNRSDAWDFLPEPVGRACSDTVEMKRCRAAWIELSMFAKAVLRAEERGVRPA